MQELLDELRLLASTVRSTNEHKIQSLVNRAIEQLEISQSWGTPFDDKRRCLNCGRTTICMREEDLRPEEPGTPCTFDPTYGEMIIEIRRLRDELKRS